MVHYIHIILLLSYSINRAHCLCAHKHVMKTSTKGDRADIMQIIQINLRRSVGWGRACVCITFALFWLFLLFSFSFILHSDEQSTRSGIYRTKFPYRENWNFCVKIDNEKLCLLVNNIHFGNREKISWKYSFLIVWNQKYLKTPKLSVLNIHPKISVLSSREFCPVNNRLDGPITIWVSGIWVGVGSVLKKLPKKDF